MGIRSFQILLSLFLLIGMISCKSGKNEGKIIDKKSTDLNIVFLNKTQASEKIVKDKKDGFFDNLSLSDMSIQMKRSDMPDNGGEAKALYHEFLKSEMEDFSGEEEKFLQEVFTSAKSAVDKLNPSLYPKEIQLIKTKPNHYGPNVYYTRDEAIVLPNNIFISPNVKVQMPVMLHEIFHILSRNNDQFRDQMYELIGFYKYPEALRLPKRIADRLLTNPDGVRRDYAILLKDSNGVEQRALPLILSTKDRYDTSMPSFFAYLNFDLFPLIKISENEVTLGLNQQGESALSVEHNADFFQQIKDNTQYIIHPDEIMADNFMMAVIAHRDGNYEGFSEEGKQLILDVIEILKNYGN